MSNVLKVSLQETICTLDGRGWSRRRIARELGIDRETVGRYLLLAKPAISTPGSEEASEVKPAISTAGNGGNAGRGHAPLSRSSSSLATPACALSFHFSCAGYGSFPLRAD